MSFGFGVSDFLAVIGLANKIRKDFAGAPSAFKGALDVARSLSIALQDAEVAASERELDPEEKADLKSILDGCQNVLSELERTLDKYAELESPQTNICRKARRAWKRLSLEPVEFRDLQSRVNVNISLLSAFTSRRARDDTAKLVRQQKDQEQQAILDWLTPIDYAAQQNDFLNQRQPGTGQWLLDSAEFQSWVKTKNQTLFCPGIPGAGKTILTSIVTEELSTRFEGDSSIIVAYIYCNFKQRNEQTLENLLGSVLKQLAQGRPSLPESVESLYKRCESKKTRPSANDISTVLKTVAVDYSRIFILVDALDECRVDDNCQANLLSELSNFQTQCRVNVFATSRFIPDITEKFAQDLRLEIRANKQDVQRYVEGHMNELPRFVRRDRNLQEEISSEIVTAIDGMFLLAQLHLNSLKGKRSPTAVRDALKKLPTGSGAYDRAYSDAMERIEGQLSDQEELAKEVLSWITCAMRPLTTLELQHALAIKVGQVEFDNDNKPDIEDIVSVCAGLVTIDEESGIIRLVHYTTQEYFERTQKRWFPTANADITLCCVTYLLFDIFESGRCDTDSSFEERLRLNPLYGYAAQYWGHHAHLTLDLPLEVSRFLRCAMKVEAAGQARRALSLHPLYLRSFKNVPKQITGLHLAADFGLTETIAAQIQSTQVDVDFRDSKGHTPLSWAAMAGREAVVKLLFDTGKTEVDSRDNDGKTPLSWAALAGYKAVVKLLLDTGKVDVDSRDNRHRTPLSMAAVAGREAVVKLLLDTGKADADSRDCNGRTPLSMAAEYGQEAVVKLLLGTGKADVDSRDCCGRTPLSMAAVIGREAVVKLLLDTGKADADSRDCNGRTPLSFAARTGREAVVKLLLGTGKVDADSRDCQGQTPLSMAAECGQEAVVKLLLGTARVDADSRDCNALTALLIAAGNGHEAVVKLLLDAGMVDANSRDRIGQTSLSRAAMRGCEAVVELLLAEHSVSPNIKDSVGRTPLSYALIYGHDAVAKALLTHNRVGLDLKDFYGSSALSVAARHGRTEVVTTLLAAGCADWKSPDCLGRNPLWWAKRRGFAEIVQLLLERDISAGNSEIPVEPALESPGKSNRWCDVCTMGILKSNIYYHCQICDGGDFDICSECYNMGGRCLQNGHPLMTKCDGLEQ